MPRPAPEANIKLTGDYHLIETKPQNLKEVSASRGIQSIEYEGELNGMI
jgi:hypothetical protein